MSQMTLEYLEENQLNTSFSVGATTVRSPEWAATHKQDERGELTGALNEFNNKEISYKKRENYTQQFETKFGIEQQALLKDFSKETSKPISETTYEEFREFLIKRYQAGYRTVSADLIDGLRREGLEVRIEENLQSVEAHLNEERENSKEESQKIATFKESLQKDLEKVKRKIASADLSDKSEFEECNREVLGFVKRSDARLDEIL